MAAALHISGLATASTQMQSATLCPCVSPPDLLLQQSGSAGLVSKTGFAQDAEDCPTLQLCGVLPSACGAATDTGVRFEFAWSAQS